MTHINFLLLHSISFLQGHESANEDKTIKMNTSLIMMSQKGYKIDRLNDLRVIKCPSP